jgi:integrase
MDRYLDILAVEDTTLRTYESYARRYVRPALGELQVGRVDAEVLDSLYAQLRRCRRRCGGRQQIDHRTQADHECDKRCRQHVCRPLAASTIRQIHWILSGAFDRAVRWRWIAVSPVQASEPPPPPKPEPRPPSAPEAAKIVTEAWKDPDWGTFIWLAMTTGARRGELCGLRRSYLDLEEAVLRVPTSVYGRRGAMKQKDTKTHQQRRIALDPESVTLLREHMARVDERAAMLKSQIPADAFLFSPDPDGATPLIPDSVSQRYERLVKRLGIDTTLHKLRHYNATELIAAGVDLRTIAGRLGHGGGGTTTLRVYAAWVAEADQRAASALATRLPKPPAGSA